MDGKNIRILVSTESWDDARSIEHELRNGGLSCVVRRVDSPETLSAAVVEHRADILLADWGHVNLPPSAALKAIKDECLALPVIVIADARDEHAAAELMQRGAVTYILRSHLAHLPHAVRTTLHESMSSRRREDLLLEGFENERSYNNIFNSIADAIYIMDPKGKFLEVNEGAVRMYGFTREEFIGQTPELMSAPGMNDTAILDKLLENTLAGVPQQFEWWGRRKNGSVFPKEISLTEGVFKERHVIVASVRDITDRKRNEELLRQSEELYRAVMSQIIDGVVLFDPVSKRIFQTNDAFLSMLGYDSDEIWRLTIYDLMDPLIDRARHTFYAGPADKNIAVGESRYVRKDGTKINVETTGSRIHYGNHDMICLLVRDLSDRKHVEEQLRKEKDQVHILSRAIEQSSFMTIVTDIDGVIEYVNQKYSDVTGFSRNEVIGTKNPDVIFGLADRMMQETIWAVLRSGSEWRGMFINRTKKGIQIWESAIITPIRTGDGAFSHYLIVKEDVTERTLAAEKIQEQAMLLDASSDAVLVEDLAGVVKYWNKGAEHLYGYTMSEAIQTNFLQRISYENSTTPERISKILFEKGVWRGEVKQASKSGKVIYVDSRRTLMRDSGGLPKSVLTVNTDITEKKTLQSQFLRAQRLESLGTLAGGIAHDLNNVLAPILMAVQMMRSQLTSERRDRALTTIEVSATRGKEILQQVLTFAKGVDGDSTVFQPRLLIRELEHLIKETFPRSIQIRTDSPNDLWMLSGSITRIHQVMMNLCVNARDAMPNGGALGITLENIMLTEEYSRIHVSSKPGPYIVITVSDTGNGIPQDVIERIFDPFFTTKEQGRGTGLGLSTVHSIVKGYGGFVTVYSELMIGTTIKVYLPAVTCGSESAVEEIPREIHTGDGECILLIDDEHSIVNVTREILEMSGYTVITAFNGKEGLAVYENNRNRIALVLTDIMMPLMDGYTLMTALRAISPNVKIIAASGLPITIDVVQPAIATANAFLNKPYSVEKLLTMIYDVVHNNYANHPD